MTLISSAKSFVLNRIDDHSPPGVAKGIILFSVLAISLLAGSIAYLPTFVAALNEARIFLCIAYTLFYFLLLLLIVLKPITFSTRAFLLCVIIFLIGITSFYAAELMSSARLWFVCASLLACLLLGFRWALIFALVSLAFMVAYGLTEDFTLNMPQEPEQSIWIIVMSTFILIQFVVLGAISLLVKALRQSENYYRTIFETTGTAMCIFGPDTTISLVNSNFENMSGYSKQELEGKKFWAEFIHPDDLDWTKQNNYLARQDPDKAVNKYEFRFFVRNNEVRNVFMVADFIPGTNQTTASLTDITERRQAEEALRESEQQFKTLFSESPVSIIIHDKDDGEIIDANPKAYASYGLSSLEELKARGMFMEPPYSYDEALGWIRKTVNEGPQQFEWLNRDIHGETFWGQVRLIPITIHGVERVLATIVDISELKETMDALNQSKNYYRAIFETSGTAMFIIEHDTTISLVNSNFEELSGYTSQELEREKSWTDFVHPDDVEWMKETHYLRRQDPDAVPRQYEFRFITRHEEQRNVLLAVDMIPGTSRSIASAIDITERKQMEEKLKEMSFHDSLTGLYNRNFFEEEMTRIGNGRYDPVGIVVCDLDGLKFVNDTLGHQSGDQMLIQTADILRRNFRSSDIIARIGGDEFAILLTEIEPEPVEQILRRLRQAVHDLNKIQPGLPLSLSMGYALDEGEPADMQALFREADNRMYREKLQREGSARSNILQALTVSMEARDFNTENHCDRLQELAASLTRSLNLTLDVINDLYLLARFHDLGKVGIPDQILFKPGPLTEEEWRQMRQHCEIGHRIASSVPDLEPIADFILKHHECWNGQGYPLGLSGVDIPLPCRILAIVDAYDAMTSDRPYRSAMTREEAIAELRRCAGTQFDPKLVEQFIQILGQKDKE